MKKKLLIALFIVSALICIFASCGECKHEAYEVQSTVPATCVADGKTISACTSCGQTKEEVIPKNGDHKLNYVEIEPTCLEAGKNVGTCTVEGCTYVVETAGKPKLTSCDRNNYVDVVIKEATCTENGAQKKVCSICNKDVIVIGFDSTIPAKKHTYERSGILTDEEKGVSFVPANCDTDGYFARVCQDCGYDQDPITREEYAQQDGYDTTLYDDMEKWGHNYATSIGVTEATCTVGGYETFKCTNEGCDSTMNESKSEALGHTYVADETAVEGEHYTIVLQPTCQSKGTKAYICQRCKELATEGDYVVSLDTVEHQFTDTDDNYLVTALDATCDESAYKVYSCYLDPACKETKTYEYGDPLGHKWEVSGEPTCKTEGKTPYTCANVCNGEACGETKLDTPTIVIAHKKGDLVAAPTCVKNAVYKCSVCETEYEVDDEVAHGNHVYNVEISVTAPTCSAEGYTTYGCSAGDCGLTKDADYTKRIAHAFDSVTEDGRIVCIVCSAQYRDVTTQITSGNGSLCLGDCAAGSCTCGLNVEWNGYVSPKDPYVLNTNEKFTLTQVEWTDLGKTVDLEIGNGVIVFTGASNTTYTVVVYDANGTASTITANGADAQVDLYEYESVVKVEITASTAATASIYAPVK